MTAERTALVTGGARGIGRAIAERLAEGGWKVVATYNTGLDQGRELARTHGVEIRQVDLADRAESLDFARRISEEFSFGGLVNNAGILEKEPLGEMTLDAWDRTFEVNVTAPLILAQTIGPHMSRGASIVNIARMPTSDPSEASPTRPAKRLWFRSLVASQTSLAPGASG